MMIGEGGRPSSRTLITSQQPLRPYGGPWETLPEGVFSVLDIAPINPKWLLRHELAKATCGRTCPGGSRKPKG